MTPKRNLRDVILEKGRLERRLCELMETYNAQAQSLRDAIMEFDRLRDQISRGLDPDRMALGRRILDVSGNPWARTDGCASGDTIAEAAIRDIANGCPRLRETFFGNKRYEGFYQRCDCRYGYCPVHGSIVDEVGLSRDYRDRTLTDEEADAAIYYLLSFPCRNVKRQFEVELFIMGLNPGPGTTERVIIEADSKDEAEQEANDRYFPKGYGVLDSKEIIPTSES